MAKAQAEFFDYQTERMWQYYQLNVELLEIKNPKPPRFSRETGRWYVYLEEADHKKQVKERRKAREQADTFNPYSGTGLQAFNNTGLSVQERYAVRRK